MIPAPLPFLAVKKCPILNPRISVAQASHHVKDIRIAKWTRNFAHNEKNPEIDAICFFSSREASATFGRGTHRSAAHFQNGAQYDPPEGFCFDLSGISMRSSSMSAAREIGILISI